MHSKVVLPKEFTHNEIVSMKGTKGAVFLQNSLGEIALLDLNDQAMAQTP